MTQPFHKHVEFSADYLRWRLGCSDALWAELDTPEGRERVRRRAMHTPIETTKDWCAWLNNQAQIMELRAANGYPEEAAAKRAEIQEMIEMVRETCDDLERFIWEGEREVAVAR